MSKITDYTAIDSVAPNDILIAVDVSDTSMSSTGTDKKVTVSQMPFDASGAASAAQATAQGYTDTKTALNLSKAGGTMSGPIAMGGSKITGLANGTASTDAATFGQIPSSSGRFSVVDYGADPTGATDSSAAFNTCLLACLGAPVGSPVSGRIPKGVFYIPPGNFKISGDFLIQSVQGFNMQGAGPWLTRIQASGSGFTNALLNIDGSADGLYEGFSLEGTGAHQVPTMLNLTWTTAAARSTSGNSFRDIRITNANYVTGFSMAGIGTRQVDATHLEHITISGGQSLGSWSTSARVDTGCGTNTTTTVTDAAAIAGDLNKVIAGAGIPAGSYITAVNAGFGYTISAAATATSSGLTFTIGTSNWQKGIEFGNGSQGNIYNQYLYDVVPSNFYYGFYCNASSFALWGAEPFGNAIDFYMSPDAPCVIECVQSQNAGQFIVCPAAGAISPVGVRDCQFKGYASSGYTNLPWITTGTSYGNWVFENVQNAVFNPSTQPVINLAAGSGGSYNACYTLINVSQANTPAAGIIPGAGVQVVAVNYQDTTAGGGPAAVLYPFYAVNAGVLYKQGTAAARPAAATYGEMFYYATDTSTLSRSNGTAWTTMGISATAPDIQWYTTPGTATWTKPAGAVTTESFVLSGGSGAGSGRRGAINTVRCGGGGGAGTPLMTRKFATADLTPTVIVTVGDGGNGGPAITTDDTSGINGSPGNTSSFGAYLIGPAYAGGLGGTAALGTGAAGLGAISGNAGSASTTGGPGVGANAAPLGAAGGPSGGGITTGNVAGNGVGGSYSYLSSGSSTTFGALGTVDTTPPTAGTSTGIKGAPGGSPGSGAASITTAAQNGASAYANSGAGGAGGGASLNGNNSGAGGKGGSGFVFVISYFQ